MTRSPAPVTIPVNSPLYPPPPYACEGSKTVYFIYDADIGRLREVLPEPLEPAAEGKVMVMLRELHFPGSLGDYGETIVNVLARFQGSLGWYIAYIYCDSDLALASGREIWGTPKKWGTTRFQKTDSLIEASLEVRGVELVRARAEVQGPARPDEMLPACRGREVTNFCLKIIPSIVDGRPEIKQLISVPRRSMKMEDFQRCQGKVELPARPGFDPLHRLAPKGEERVFYGVFDYVLGYGVVAHDYLKA